MQVRKVNCMFLGAVHNIAFYTEASNERGYGHLFRTIKLHNKLKERGIGGFLFLKPDLRSEQILGDMGIEFATINLNNQIQLADFASNLSKYKICVIDCLGIPQQLLKVVSEARVPFVTFDDPTEGAQLAEINFSSTYFAQKVFGKKVIQSPEFIIFDDSISQYRRKRDSSRKLVVTLGGSDTYGATISVIESLNKLYEENKNRLIIEIHLGPGFKMVDELQRANLYLYKINGFQKSFSQFLNSFDLAITGGGMTAFESLALGIPTAIVANEYFEISVADHLVKECGSVYLGFRQIEYIDRLNEFLNSEKSKLEEMSQIALSQMSVDGLARTAELIGKELYDCHSPT